MLPGRDALVLIKKINPFECQMWCFHDRHNDDDAEKSAHRRLLTSIRTQGQKHPVLGRRIEGHEPIKVELIYGARRLAVARELNIELLIEIREIDDRAGLVEMDIENRVRDDITSYERGLSYRRWLRSGLFSSQAEIAKEIGVSEAQVCRLLKYSELPAAVISAFSSPRDIREDWAGLLAKLCKDPRKRDAISRKARAIATGEKRPKPAEILTRLTGDSKDQRTRSRSKDDIIRGRSSQPLFRIGYRARTVHIIIPRTTVTASLLEQVSEQIKSTLEVSPNATI
jgi:ParB/RepB/Spo0J family partition protein